MGQKKKAILITLDALAGAEYEAIQKLPNFSRMLRSGACCPYERSVYPSLTFPCHASIATGCNPGTHGIVSNYLPEPGLERPHWNFYAKNLRRPALWDYASDAGRKVLSMSWPVSSGGKIRWSMPEMTPAKPKIWDADSFIRQLGVFYRYGTPGFCWKTLLSHKGLAESWFLGRQPQLDEHMIGAFLRADSEKPFDIALLHIYGMDDAKHTFGTRSPQAAKYLKLYDRFAGRLMAYVDQERKKGVHTTLLITGDHSQKDTHSAIYGNYLLSLLGLSRLQDGLVAEYRAYLDSCDGMAYIYLNKELQGDRQETLDLVRACFRDHPGVKAVLEPSELRALGGDPDADLALEAKEGYYFKSGRWPDGTPPDRNGIAPADHKAVHGYLPEDPDYYTMMLAYGPDVRPGIVERMGLIDILPTLCQWMDIPFGPVEGTVIPGLLQDPEQ